MTTRNKALSIIVIASGLSLAGLIRFGAILKNEAVVPGSTAAAAAYHTAKPDTSAFYDTVYGFDGKDMDLSGKSVAAGIVTHHLLAGDMIAEFYHNLAGRDYDTVILAGPNHFDEGKAKVISSAYDWQTPFGVLSCDREMLGRLRAVWPGLGIEPAAVDSEHAITSQAGFIKKTFPKAKFLFLIIRPNLGPLEAGTLAKALLAVKGNEKTLLIASVDFSHYTDSLTAVAQDRNTLKVIGSNDFKDVYTIKADSPPSVYIAMKYAEAAGAGFELLRNSNSAILAGKPELRETTSYITGYFIEK